MPPAWTRRLEEDLLADQVTRCYERSPVLPPQAGRGRRSARARAERRRPAPHPLHDEGGAQGLAGGGPPARRLRLRRPRGGRARAPDLGDDGQAARPRLHGRGPEDLPRGSAPGPSGRRVYRPTTSSSTASTTASTRRPGRPRGSRGDRSDDGAGRSGAEQAAARALEDLRPTALFSTLTYPLYLAETAEEAGIDPRGLGLRKLIVAGEPGGQL